MNRIIVLLLSMFMSLSTSYADGVSTTPNILNSIDGVPMEYLLTEEKFATRGEYFRASWNKSALTKAREWCRGRGVCWFSGNLFLARATDPRRDGSIVIKSY
ncbi:MAG: hypothetical protein P8179_10710 [Candidatus Thiodiazotropha sp.]